VHLREEGMNRDILKRRQIPGLKDVAGEKRKRVWS